MRVQSSGFMVQGSGSRVQGSGFGVQGWWCRVQRSTPYHHPGACVDEMLPRQAGAGGDACVRVPWDGDGQVGLDQLLAVCRNHWSLGFRV